MDSVISWAFLVIMAFTGLGYFVKAILTEIEEKHRKSEELWRQEEWF